MGSRVHKAFLFDIRYPSIPVDLSWQPQDHSSLLICVTPRLNFYEQRVRCHFVDEVSIVFAHFLSINDILYEIYD
jgi:hypothetical protein